MPLIIYTEHQEQAELIRWTKEPHTLRLYPEVEWLFAVPNGAKLPYTGKGKQRRSRQAVILKAEGLKPGVPDLCLPVPAGGYHGLWIEMKSFRKGAKVSKDQAEWLKQLQVYGFCCKVCVGWVEARDEIMLYLNSRHDPETRARFGLEEIKTFEVGEK
ncbi:MAG: VRR-NUC domain-containing protein [Pelolinea sp.]|nr:VRR-NUC domain-containing protein [Pelolinea sp.]